MDKEKKIKDEFFAAYKPEDVERYKAALPVYWKFWPGKKADNGFVVNLEALEDIHAPSPKHTFELFRDTFDDNITVHSYGPPETKTIRDHLKSIISDNGRNDTSLLDDDTIARRMLPQAALLWKDPDMPLTKVFMDRVKSEGFNAVVDLNDAGTLSDTPIRVLKGKAFKIAGHEVLSKELIDQAQKNVLELAHMLMKKGFISETNFDDFLEHFGVRGMRWGQRRSSSSGTVSPHAKRNKALKIGAGIAGVAAVSAGGIFVAKFMDRHGTMKAAEALNLKDLRGEQATLKLFKANKDNKTKYITKAYALRNTG